MKILIEKEYFYASSKKANLTDYYGKHGRQRYCSLCTLWDSFKDILQELMEDEMDAALGYEKIKKK